MIILIIILGINNNFNKIIKYNKKILIIIIKCKQYHKKLMKLPLIKIIKIILFKKILEYNNHNRNIKCKISKINIKTK